MSLQTVIWCDKCKSNHFRGYPRQDAKDVIAESVVKYGWLITHSQDYCPICKKEILKQLKKKFKK